MVQKLFNFSYKRNFLDALIFYIFYLVIFYIIIFFIKDLTYVIFNLKSNTQIVSWINIFFIVLLSMGFSFVILMKKNLYSDYRYIITIILVGILSFIFEGFIISMFLIAFLTTLNINEGK